MGGDVEQLRAEAESLRKKIKVTIAHVTIKLTNDLPLISDSLFVLKMMLLLCLIFLIL